MTIHPTIKKAFEKIQSQFKLLPTRQQQLLTILLITIFVSLYVNFIYKERVAELRKARREVITLNNRMTTIKSEIPNLKKEQDNLTAAQQRLDTLQKELSSLEGYLPSASSIPQLLGELVRQSQGYAIDFASIRPEKTEQKKEYAQLRIEMKFYATYADVVNYLNRLESLTQFLEATHVTLKEPKEGTYGEVETTITLATLLGSEKSGKQQPPKRLSAVRPITIMDSPFRSKLAGDPTPAQRDPWGLSGIIASGENPTAIIKNQIYHVGDSISNNKIVQILPNMVILSDGVKKSVLTLDY